MTILVVEDNADDRFLMDRAFASLGIATQVHFAETIAEAWDYPSGDGTFADRTLFPLPKLIITDLNLPGESGFTLLRRRMQVPALNNIPVLVFTSSTRSQDISTANKLGAKSYHVKPVSYREFKNELELMCNACGLTATAPEAL